MHQTGRREEECICVLQLTEAGDIFYQILQPEVDAACARDACAEGGSPRSVQGRVAEAGLSSSSLSTWRRWLMKLMRRRRRSASGPRALQHMLVNAAGLLRRCPAADAPDPSEKACVERLRQEMTTCMAERSLLLRSTVSASLGPSQLPPLPSRVEADAWTDDLSRRLTASWRGEEAWRSWWTEKLGLDRERKAEDVKRRRRRQKEARRAAGRRLQLSDSFSSSASCLSEWNDLSDSTGGFSAASQPAWSDGEGAKSPRSQSSSAAAPTGSPVLTPTARGKQSTSCPALGSQTPTVTPSRKRSRDPLDSSLSALLPPQVRRCLMLWVKASPVDLWAPHGSWDESWKVRRSLASRLLKAFRKFWTPAVTLSVQ